MTTYWWIWIAAPVSVLLSWLLSRKIGRQIGIVESSGSFRRGCQSISRSHRFKARFDRDDSRQTGTRSARCIPRVPISRN